MSTHKASPHTCLSLVCAGILGLALFGCGGDDTSSDTETETSAGSGPGATFIVDVDGSLLCGAATDRVEFATRRVGCWDPEIPCTLPAMPVWVPGTIMNCSDLSSGSGSIMWSLRVDGAGQYETQLRALAGDMQEGVHCYANTEDLTRVSSEDLETQAVLALNEIADTNCSNP